MDYQSLYSITGDIKDINTVLVNRADLAAQQKDAGRYRWLLGDLRVTAGVNSKGRRSLMAYWPGLGIKADTDAALTAAIDAEMAKGV